MNDVCADTPAKRRLLISNESSMWALPKSPIFGSSLPHLHLQVHKKVFSSIEVRLFFVNLEMPQSLVALE